MRLKYFLFLGRRGESLGTYARHLFEDAREIELIGEAAHLGYLIDLIIVDIAREQQFLRVVDARAVEELQGRDPLFLDELPSQIILAQGNVAIDLVYAERGIGKLSTIMLDMFSTCCELPAVPEKAESMLIKSSVSETMSSGCWRILVLK